jgi:hypothetical protein
MKLTWKLTVFLVLGTLAVTAAHAAYRIRQEAGSFEADIRQDNDLLGRAVAAAARRMYETAGEAPALELVQSFQPSQSSSARPSSMDQMGNWRTQSSYMSTISAAVLVRK